MKDNKYSKTAEAAAFMRAAHYIESDSRIFLDPYASKLTSTRWKFVLANKPLRFILKKIFMRDLYNSVSGQILSRSRYAEDCLYQAIENGMEQYVILGAGMDSFAIRNSALKDRIKIFEVDHPASQENKKAKLEKYGLKSSVNLIYVPVDFNKDRLTEALDAAGFDRNRPAFFSWIATSFYLTKDTIFDTFRLLNEYASEGSQLVFDYNLEESVLSEEAKVQSQTTKRFVASKGEVYLSAFTDEELESNMRDIGYEIIECATPEVLQERYFQNRKDDLKAALWASMLHVKSIGKLQ